MHCFKDMDNINNKHCIYSNTSQLVISLLCRQEAAEIYSQNRTALNFNTLTSGNFPFLPFDMNISVR